MCLVPGIGCTPPHPMPRIRWICGTQNVYEVIIAQETWSKLLPTTAKMLYNSTQYILYSALYITVSPRHLRSVCGNSLLNHLYRMVHETRK